MSLVRHDWYQTDEKVVIDVLVKNANNRNCTVDIQPNRVSVNGDNIQLNLNIAHEIDTVKSSFRISSVKIEITLQKLVGERWSSLTENNDSSKPVTALPIPKQHQQPESSTESKEDKNWDRVVKDAWDKEDIEKVKISNFYLTELVF